MVETPENFGRDIPCKLCNLSRDQMSHVLECVVIKLACPELITNPVKIADAFDSNMENVRNLAVTYQKAWRVRQKLLEQ